MSWLEFSSKLKRAIISFLFTKVLRPPKMKRPCLKAAINHFCNGPTLKGSLPRFVHPTSPRIPTMPGTMRSRCEKKGWMQGLLARSAIYCLRDRKCLRELWLHDSRRQCPSSWVRLRGAFPSALKVPPRSAVAEQSERTAEWTAASQPCFDHFDSMASPDAWRPMKLVNQIHTCGIYTCQHRSSARYSWMQALPRAQTIVCPYSCVEAYTWWWAFDFRGEDNALMRLCYSRGGVALSFLVPWVSPSFVGNLHLCRTMKFDGEECGTVAPLRCRRPKQCRYSLHLQWSFNFHCCQHLAKAVSKSLRPSRVRERLAPQ